MKFHHPQRPRLPNGLPAFLTSPQVAIPRACITPEPDGRWRIEWIINGSPKALITLLLEETLRQWEEDPEGFISSQFHTTPNSPIFWGTETPHNPKQSPNPADIGL